MLEFIFGITLGVMTFAAYAGVWFASLYIEIRRENEALQYSNVLQYKNPKSTVVLESLIREISIIRGAEDKKRFLGQSLRRLECIDETEIKDDLSLRVFREIKQISSLLPHPSVKNLLAIERILSSIQEDIVSDLTAQNLGNVIIFQKHTSKKSVGDEKLHS